MAAKQDVKRLVDHMFLPPKLPHSADNGSHLFLVRATLRALSKWQPVHDLEQKSINRAIASLRSILAIHTLADDGIDQPHTISLLQKLRAGGTIDLQIIDKKHNELIDIYKKQNIPVYIIDGNNDQNTVYNDVKKCIKNILNITSI